MQLLSSLREKKENMLSRRHVSLRMLVRGSKSPVHIDPPAEDSAVVRAGQTQQSWPGLGGNEGRSRPG